MPWVTGRETLPALAPDPAWRGRSIKLFPTAFWGVGTPQGASWVDGGIDIRVCWVNASGRPLFVDADVVTIEPAQADVLPFSGGSAELISLGPSRITAAYVTERILMPPRGSVSVRVTNITALGADRAFIQFWRAV